MFFDTVMDRCRRIKNGRNIGDVLSALFDESSELEDEVAFARMGISPGEDGIVGESVDVILCAMDVIYQAKPEITKEEFMSIVERKLDKWENVHG